MVEKGPHNEVLSHSTTIAAGKLRISGEAVTTIV
jgi:hypothetical protein